MSSSSYQSRPEREAGDSSLGEPHGHAGGPRLTANDNLGRDDLPPLQANPLAPLINARRRALGLASPHADGPTTSTLIASFSKASQLSKRRSDGISAEWAAGTAAVRQRHGDALRRIYGVPMQTIIDRVGVSRIRPEGTHYEPDDDGIEVVLIACYEAPPRLPDGRWRASNEVIDLVAFRPADPHHWWSRRGLVAALGEEGLSDFCDEPVPVWGDPLTWLRAGATGICPVSDDPGAARDVLIRLPGIVAMDANHGREIRRLLDRQWNKLPAIFVAEPAKEVA